MGKRKVELPESVDLHEVALSALEAALKDTKHISPTFIDKAYREGAAFGYSIALKEMQDRVVLSFFESSKLADLLHVLRPLVTGIDAPKGDLQLLTSSIEILTQALKCKAPSAQKGH